MAEKSFTEKQREVVARKMGFEGPMDMFDSYLKSNPADARRYGLITETFLAKGGMVKKNKKVRKMAEGGAVPGSREAIAQMYRDVLKREPDASGLNYWSQEFGDTLEPEEMRAWQASAQVELDKAAQNPQVPVSSPLVAPEAAQVTAAQIQSTPEQYINTQLAPEQASTIQAAAQAPIYTAAAPEALPAAKVGTVTAGEVVQGETARLKAAQGTVSDQSLVTAAQAKPTETAVANVEAAQGVANQITNIPQRTLVDAELVQGTTIDQAKVDAALKQNEANAAQGIVTDDMTVQGQLNKLYTDFEAGNPPAWAASSLRSANAVLAARGVGASSIAGQAIVQAALEAAMPIAAADAATSAQMGFANLSNRQQMAMLTAQQRAQFLGQEFDQAFQTKVLNAAKISDIANANFGAEVQVTLENARLAQTMDLANLSNRQAKVMATAAQIANLEMANLSNTQQARVLNAQAFLQMDMANLANTQQTELFKTQTNVQAILSDVAMLNAAAQFNASSENQTNQFFAQLITQADQFNVAQMNAMGQFNVGQTNSVAEFNAQAQNLRDQFNAQNRLVIDQSNAQWRRDLATANTAAINRANEFNATKAQEITTIDYNNRWQQFRDELEYSWRSSESAAERANRIAISEISANADILVATAAKDAALTKQIAQSATSILAGTDVGGAAKSIIRTISDLAPGVIDSIVDWTSGLFNDYDYAFQDYVPPPADYVAPNFEE